MSCFWYISKYVAPPTEVSSGGRGYILMRELCDVGHQCVIITSDSHAQVKVPVLKKRYQREFDDGLEVWWVKTLKYRKAKSLSRILSWLDFELCLLLMPKSDLPRPDSIVVSSLSLLTILNGVFLSRRYSCRLVFEIRDIWPLTLTEEGRFSKWNPLVIFLSWLEVFGYRKADAIVGTMPNLAEHVEQVLGTKKTVHCVPMGIDERSVLSRAELPIDYVDQFIPLEKFIVVYAGTIGITNALHTLLDCAELMQSNRKVHFLVLGDGDLKDYYVKTYSNLKNLTFAPKVPKSMVHSVLTRCSLLYFSTHPSGVWRYGQSLNKLIDYMLAGKPIIASYSGFPSMIDESGSGSFIPAGDVDSLRVEIERYASMTSEDLRIIGEKAPTWLFSERNYKKIASDYLSIISGTI